MNKIIYNDAIKNKFINENFRETNTKETVKYLFSRISNKLEFKLEKDLYSFGENELIKLFKELRITSKQIFFFYKSYISKYLDWAIDNNYTNTKDNLIKNSPKFEDAKNFLDKAAINNKYLTKEQLDDIVFKTCQNDQDVALLLLLFEGVKGERLEELCNLKPSDIDFNNNILTLTDKDGTKRNINVTSKAITAIERAIKEDEYEAYLPPADNNTRYRKLINRGYVFKKTSKRGGDKITYSGLYTRIKTIAEEYGNRYINIANVWWSGIFHTAKEIKQEKGKITREDFLKIREKYNAPTGVAISKFENKILNRI